MLRSEFVSCSVYLVSGSFGEICGHDLTDFLLGILDSLINFAEIFFVLVWCTFPEHCLRM